MNTPEGSPAVTADPAPLPAPRQNALRGLPPQLVLGLVLLLGVFSVPLVRLARFSFSNDLYSYIPLIPFVSLYLVWLQRGVFRAGGAPRRGLALWFATGAALAGGWAWSGCFAHEADQLAATTLSLLLATVALCCACLGERVLRVLLFPLSFLIFAIPLPYGGYMAIETFLEKASTDVAEIMFELGQTPIWRQNFVLHLPGMNLEVAPECCGIHSTLVLFITGFLAAYLYLRSFRARAILIAAILPIALLRNGFRIFVIGELCVHISPDMIDSWIHHHGGPVFFVLSLIPFLALLRWLRRRDFACAARAS